MTRADIRPGDWLVCNQPKVAGKRRQIIEIDGHVAVARDERGVERRYQLIYVYTDGQPRRWGWNWEPAR